MGNKLNTVMLQDSPDVSVGIRKLRHLTRFPICALADYLEVSLLDYVDLEEGRRDLTPKEESLLSELYGFDIGRLSSPEGWAEVVLPLIGKPVENLNGEDLHQVADMVSSYRNKLEMRFNDISSVEA